MLDRTDFLDVKNLAAKTENWLRPTDLNRRRHCSNSRQRALIETMPSQLKSSCALALLSCAIVVSASAAASGQTPSRYVFFDFRDPKAPSSKRVYSLPTDGVALNDSSTVDQVVQFLAAHKAKSAFRWISSRGDTVGVFVIGTAATKADFALRVNVEFDEQERQSRFVTDLMTLLQIVGRAAAPPEQFYFQTYTLQDTRANLAITATVTPQGKTAEAATSTEKSNGKLTATLVTGPREHLFLSADLPVTRVSELKLTDGTTIAPSKDPTSFYIGINYALGDLLSKARAVNDYLFLKGVVKAATNRPLSSVGAGLGLRGFSVAGIDFDIASPFILWTSSRLEDDNGVATGERATAVRWGISFNLNRALKWGKSSNAGAEH